MEYFFTFTTLYLILLIIPGPDLLLVLNNTTIHNKKAGLLTSTGISCGFLVHFTYTSLGLAILITKNPFLYDVLRYSGGLYLIYLGAKEIINYGKVIKQSASNDLKEEYKSGISYFYQGFFCNVLNPKVTIFFISILSALINVSFNSTQFVFYGIEVFMLSILWFACIATLIIHSVGKELAFNRKKMMNILFGILIVFCGIFVLFLPR